MSRAELEQHAISLALQAAELHPDSPDRQIAWLAMQLARCDRDRCMGFGRRGCATSVAELMDD